MTLRRRVTTAILAGAVATSVIAPTSVFAASQGDVKVQYIGGALVPDGSDGTYYITIPSNITFTGTNDIKSMDVQLHRTDVTKTLNSALAVTVDVYSTNDYKLKNNSFSGIEGTYQLVYTSDNATNKDTVLTNKTPNSPSADNGAEVGILSPDSNLNTTEGTNANKSLVGSITGTAQLTKEPNVTVPGTPFTDTLTYYVTQTNPSVTQ